MHRPQIMFALLSASVVTTAFSFDCSFASTYPRQYIAYKVQEDPVQDGTLQGPLWQEVSFTERFVDINTTTSPRLSTHAKVRWDDTFLYVGALLEEPQAFANITSTCHCLNNSQDQVIFHDNDFEIFVDPSGSTHFYKEYEMNALNATWDLELNRPYDDGGGENSSRVYGGAGWDYAPPIGGRHTLHSAAHVWGGAINNPALGSTAWSVEVALPLAKLVENTPATLPIVPGETFWRINFSRVEWAVKVVEGGYWKEPSCQSCPVPGAAHEDNWAWSPQGSIAMHLPEKWGFLQFEEGAVNASALRVNREWPVRSVAAAVYYAQHAFAGDHGGNFTDTLADLAPYLDSLDIVDGTCTLGKPVSVALWVDPAGGGPRFNASIPPSSAGDHTVSASIDDQRLLLTHK
jgi:hypothetical protein